MSTDNGAGAHELRRQFVLGEDDQKALNARGQRWETVVEGNQRWLVIHDYPVGEGYNHSAVQTGLMIGTTYPDTQIDMVYFCPDLHRRDGRPVRALASHRFDGKTWQRWSRHRTSQNPWRPGIDNIATHLELVDYWLRREFDA